jgi:hypothetical protein
VERQGLIVEKKRPGPREKELRMIPKNNILLVVAGSLSEKLPVTTGAFRNAEDNFAKKQPLYRLALRLRPPAGEYSDHGLKIDCFH